MEKIIEKPINTGGSWGLNDVVVKDMIKRIIPATITDFGCGLGKYGLMIRETLDYSPKIIGVDGFEPTIEWLKTQNIYDILTCAKMQEVEFVENDLAIFGDCLEHLEFNEAIEVVERATKSFKYIIIVVPLNKTEQGVCGNNVLEQHKCSFNSKSFDKYNVVEKHLVSGKMVNGVMVKMAILIENI